MSTSGVEALLTLFDRANESASESRGRICGSYDNIFWQGDDWRRAMQDVDDLVRRLDDLGTSLSEAARILRSQVAEQQSASQSQQTDLSQFIALDGSDDGASGVGSSRSPRDRDRSDERERNDDASRGRGRDLPGNNLDNDWAGREILARYMSGGSDWDINDDPEWTAYMSDIIEPHAGDLHANMAPLVSEAIDGDGTIDGSFPMEVTNGEGIRGDNYLHGTNQDLGGYAVNGTATVVETLPTVPVSCAWRRNIPGTTGSTPTAST